MSKNESLADRISIAYLLAITTSVAIAFSTLRLLAYLNFKIETAFFPDSSPNGSLNSADYPIALLYGVCLATAFFAIRREGFWKSPGKVISVLFASMCVLNWGLDILAASIVCSRLPGGDELQMQSTELGVISGLWYRALAPAAGYVIGFFIILFMNFKVQPRHMVWRLVWVGFLFFDVAMILWVYGIVNLPLLWYQWHLEATLGVPVVLIAISLVVDFFGGHKNDWWTVAMGGLLIFVWSAVVLAKIFGTLFG